MSTAGVRRPFLWRQKSHAPTVSKATKASVTPTPMPAAAPVERLDLEVEAIGTILVITGWDIVEVFIQKSVTLCYQPDCIAIHNELRLTPLRTLTGVTMPTAIPHNTSPLLRVIGTAMPPDVITVGVSVAAVSTILVALSASHVKESSEAASCRKIVTVLVSVYVLLSVM